MDQQITDGSHDCTHSHAFMEELSTLKEQLESDAPVMQVTATINSLERHLDVICSSVVQNGPDKDELIDGTILCQSITHLLKYAQVPDNYKQENEAWDDVAMTTFSERASLSMSFVKTLLKSLSRERTEHAQIELRNTIVRRCISLLICICAGHDSDQLWSSVDSVNRSKDLQAVLCTVCNVTSIKDLLTYNNPLGTPEQDRVLSQEVFSVILKSLQPHLKKNTWKKEPVSRHVYQWCLMKIMHPHLGQHLEMVLPPALLFTDDFQVHNKILGTRCLHHIIREVDATELRWYNRGDVIYAALHSQIYSNKVPLLDEVIACVLSILVVIEKSPKIADSVRKTNKYDKVLQILLRNMEGEQLINLRRLYLKHVPLFIEKMGITILRHIKPLLRIITSFLEVSDGQKEEGRLATLQLLNILMLHAKPSLSGHAEQLLKSLLRFLYDACLPDFNSSQDVTTQIQNTIVVSLKQLQESCYDVVRENLLQLLESELSGITPFVDCINRIVSVSKEAIDEHDQWGLPPGLVEMTQVVRSSSPDSEHSRTDHIAIGGTPSTVLHSELDFVSCEQNRVHNDYWKATGAFERTPSYQSSHTESAINPTEDNIKLIGALKLSEH